MKKISSKQYAVSSDNDAKLDIALISTSTIVFNGEVVAEHETESIRFRAIRKAIQIALNSNWFIHILKEETRANYLAVIIAFYEWLVQSGTDPSFSIIKSFETDEINSGLKPQSTKARKLISLLKKGLYEGGLNVEEFRFVKELCRKTRLVKYEPPEAVNLGQWFAKHQWIRNHIGDDYQRLASPKRLMSSFVVTVAATLITLLRVRKSVRENKDVSQRYLDSSKAQTSPRKTQKLVSDLLLSVSQSNDIRSAEILNVIEMECIKRSHETRVKKIVSSSSGNGYGKVLEGINSDYPYYRPILFVSEEFSKAEQLLMYFLLCNLAIQPTDANNITRSNFSIKYNKQGKPRLIRVEYLKGRGNSYHETPLLRVGEIAFEAIELYLSLLPPDHNKLFSENMVDSFILSNPNYAGRRSTPPNNTSTLFKLWSDSTFSETLKGQFRKHNTDDLFLKAFDCFMQPDIETFNFWQKNNTEKGLYVEYLSRVEKNCPQSLFTGTHVKNTSVYSRTDKYRDKDLINTNSHSSLTEKLSYMTDNNKEWVNQVGRITRMVMTDIELHAFSPNIVGMEAEVQDLRLKTKIIAEQGDESVKVNQINKVIQGTSLEDNVIVIDSVDNAVLMLHYIEQAESYYKTFVEVNPEFLESHLLINVEWMYHCLEQFAPKNLKEASLKFGKIKSVLPSLFEHELAKGVSI
ncbi:hypothetical protein [Alteromonas macleodii]|uniref:hypothetical protein n=1 Tax=Alteromonas macleodii TaxID=28108 RepID=UPI000C794B3B|nr:hypothetical protein [Alteromonas macleodii]AUI82882.1 hypothetical protein TE101_11530 [Alteromonas macleodii]